MTRSDIAQGGYVRLNTSRLGCPAGLIGKVYTVGTDQTGTWYFQLRYLNPGPGTKTRPRSQWSLNLHDEDLIYFDRIDSREVQQFLTIPPMVKEASPPSKDVDPNQLRLFDEEWESLEGTQRGSVGQL